MSKVGSGGGLSRIQLEIRDEKAKGVIDKRFQDDFFALDLLKTLYEDTVDNNAKVELLIALEEYGHHGVEADSVDQIVTSLLDICHQSADREDNSALCCQLLTTSTSLLIQLNQLDSDVCRVLIKELVSVVTSRVNQPDSRRLRACACQCLIHIEEFSVGKLCGYRDEFGRLAKQERTDVGQDYMLLLAKVLESVGDLTEDTVVSHQPSQDKLHTGKQRKPLQKQFSMEPQEFRQTVAQLVESHTLYTRCATWRLMKSLTKLVKTIPEASPMIFRPLMIHHMASMNAVIFHLILYLQREFVSEVLTQQEESELIDRLAILLDHPSLTPAQRLLTMQWTQHYKQDESGKEAVLCEQFRRQYRLKFYPSVFDPVDCQLSSLYMTALSADTAANSEGLETSVLLGSLGCLHKLVWHTGKSRAAIALFRALFFIYKRHHSPSFSQDIQRFVEGLISNFPHFIPHAVDFIECIRVSTPESEVYLQTLSMLHQQVVMATEDQIVYFYDFYLQVLKKAALERDLTQAPTLKFLHYLAENAGEIADTSWRLGHGILSVCRNLLICHGTQFLYTGMGDLLFYIMTKFQDVDVQDKARFYYALLTGASDAKIRSVLEDRLYGAHTINQALSTLLPGDKEERNLAQIHILDTSVFSWERVGVSALSKQTSGSPGQGVKDTGTAAEQVQEYFTHLKTRKTSIDLNFNLRLDKDADFDKVHAVTVHIVSTDLYEPVKDTHVPCVTKSGSQGVIIHIYPRTPLPQAMTASVTFASDERKTYSCKLPQVPVVFEELLLPLPWQHKGVNYKEFFYELWDTILKEQQYKRRGVESVKVLDITAEQFQSVCSTKLSKFHLSSTEDSQDDQEALFAMFLPAEYHILLKCRQTDKQTLVVSIATDLWNILPHIDKYLQSLEQ